MYILMFALGALTGILYAGYSIYSAVKRRAKEGLRPYIDDAGELAWRRGE
jgi:hypothetical protein